MYANPDTQWFVWTDDDTYINPGWAYMPLDVFLGDIPLDKVYVSGNYRCAFTDVFAIRNTPRGRRLMRDWIAILLSGAIQCHGYDQAALQTLVLQRISNSNTIPGKPANGNGNVFSPKPMNFTCWYNKANSAVGCTDNADWSCDFKFEKALYKAGYTSKSHHFHNDMISSYTKGCLNNHIDDFYVIKESPSRPRFKVGLTTQADEIGNAYHWDGPLGGGNDLVKRGAVNGWFFNHKMPSLFYDLYLNPDNCIKVDHVVEPCGSLPLASRKNPALAAAFFKSRKSKTGSNKGGEGHGGVDSNILSLTDGYAFDLDLQTFCTLTSKSSLEHQLKNTYMKDYPTTIVNINKVPHEEWWYNYLSFEGIEGMSSCVKHNCPKNSLSCLQTSTSNAAGEKRPCPPSGVSPRPKNSEEAFFEVDNLCETCTSREVDHFDGVPDRKHNVLGCGKTI